MKSIVLAGLLLLTLAWQPSVSAEKVCWPLHFAGITVGETTDAQVCRLLGDGVFRKEDGDTGRRVFVDRGHTATLHVVCFTDSVVGELTLTSGVVGLSEKELPKATTKYFDPAEGFGNWHALHLGSTDEEVMKNLGEPEKKDKDGGWVYFTACACEIPEYFTIYFEKRRVVRLVLSAPAG